MEKLAINDLLIMETGNGGDLVLRGNDLAAVAGVENIPYLEMFGGDDWWGNIFYQDKPELQYDAQTESVLKSNCLTSSGRQKIEAAIKNDLAFLISNTGAALKVSTFMSADRIEIKVEFSGQTFYYLWDPATEYLSYKV